MNTLTPTAQLTHSEGVNRKALTAPHMDAVLAKAIALSARNSVEDLHVAGAFSDKQAPTLNRQIRGRIYELLLATRRGEPGKRGDAFTVYVDELAAGYKGGRAVAALQGAVGRAVDDFAAAEAIDAATATKLRIAAISGAVQAFKTINRLSSGRSKDEEQDRFALAWWLYSVPKYWEEPEVSPEFQKLLDDHEAARPRP